MNSETWNITLKEDNHIFTILDTQSQIVVFSEIFKNCIKYHWTNDLINRELIILKLTNKGKTINMPRYMTIFKQLVDKNVLIRISKGEYEINVKLITKQ